MSTAQNDTIDLMGFIRKALRLWWVFLITCTIAGAAAVFYIKTTPKNFQVNGVMLMSDTKRNSFGSGREDFIRGTSYLSSKSGLEDDISVLTSFTNNLNTIRQLDFSITYYVERNFKTSEIYEDKPFIIRLDTGLQVTGIKLELIPDLANGTYRVRAKQKYVSLFDAGLQKPAEGFLKDYELDKTVPMGEHFRSPNLNFTVEFDPNFKYPDDARYFFVPSSHAAMASYYRSKTRVEPLSDESNIITISTVGEDVKKEIDYINTLMQTYIKGEQDKQNEKGNKTIAFIDQQLNRSAGDLQMAEGDLQEVQASAGGLVGSAGDRGAAVFSDLSRLKDEHGRALARLGYISELITHMGSDDGGVPSTISAANIGAPSLSNLIDSYNKNVNDLATRRLTERQQSAPTIALARRVQTQRNQIIQSAQDARRAAQMDVDGLSTRINQLEYQLDKLPQSSRQVSIATRKYELSASINTYLLEKRYEAEIAVNSDQVDKYIIDSARLVEGGPVSPKKGKTLAMALALGLALPLVFILLRDLFNDRIQDKDELMRLSAIPLLSTIPEAPRQYRVKAVDDRSIVAESFRTVRINLQYLNRDIDKQVVGVTSSASGEGKTFCAVNLASVMALGNKRTVLLDTDMRKPKAHERFGMELGTGLSTYLINEAGLDQVIRKTDVPGLDLITAGPIPPNPLELFESPRMAELLQQLRGRYDQVIVDASPMGVVSEFKVLLHHLDLTLYVVRAGYTRRAMLKPVNELFAKGKIKNIDLLLNDVKAEEGYGYAYAAK